MTSSPLRTRAAHRCGHSHRSPQRGGDLRISSGSEFTDAYLGANEQVKGESYVEGQRLKVYMVEVRKATKGPQVIISRTHPSGQAPLRAGSA